MSISSPQQKRGPQDQSGRPDLNVNPPLGGYIIALGCGLFVLLSPYVAIQSALGGDLIAGVLVVVLGIPIWLGLGLMGLRLNQEARVFRRHLRTNHHWLSSAGVSARLGYVLLLAVLAGLDLLVNPGLVGWQYPIVLGMALAAGSAFSVMGSGFAGMFLGK